MNLENTIEWIDRYLKKELRGEELNRFEEKMRTDTDFAIEVELQRRLILAIQEEGLRQALWRTEQAIAEPRRAAETRLTAPPRVVRFPAYAVAAAVLLLIVAGVVFWTRFRPAATDLPTPELVTVVYEGTANPPFPALTTRGDTPPQYVPVLIYPPKGNYTFHYQFADTLRLFGAFNSPDLTVTYQRKDQTDHYQLQVRDTQYRLQRSESIQPLAAQP